MTYMTTAGSEELPAVGGLGEREKVELSPAKLQKLFDICK